MRRPIVEYFVGNQHITLFFLSSNGYAVQSVEKSAALEEWIADFQEAISMADYEDFIEMGVKLYDELLKPIESQLEGIERLVIIRDDVLHYLPFEALLYKSLQAASSNVAFSDLPYLLQRFEIIYHYSATLWLHQAKLPQLHAETSFTGFAPITFDGSELVATELALESAEGRTTILRSNQAGELALQALPSTESEVKNVYQLFENQQFSAKAFLYNAASKQNLKQFGKQSRFLLIATHGIASEQSEHLSGIYLAKVASERARASTKPILEGEEHTVFTVETTEAEIERKTSSTQTDYVLSIAETYNLQLNADLVVLSSCSSGIGKLQRGEGMMAINRAFLYAGARNIIFTQFDIPDKSSSELVISLFEEILEEANYSNALRKAKLQLLQNPLKSPKDWAGYVLIGG